MTNTIGFDLYFHALSAVSLDSISTLNFSVNFGFGEMPRYIFFHYILYIGTLISLPPVFTIALLNSVPVFMILTSNRMYQPVYAVSASFLVIVSVVYWSVAATVILFFFYFFYNDRELKNKPILLLALSLHYISIPLSFFYFIVVKKARLTLVIFTCIVFYFATVLYSEPQGLCSFQSTNIFNLFNLESVLIRVSYKIKELSLIAILVILIAKLQAKSKKIKRNIDVNVFFMSSILLAIIAILFISFYKQESQGRVGFFSYVNSNMSKNDESLLEYAWFNINRDINFCRIMSNRI
ncbi:hypothetical protein MO387_03420 [Shewanella sp. N2AIL]|uniref:hypothetical protein n=1 Tax=Shewanella sp. N2AIL TaxID=2926851 RepID=UPI001F595571|nr:hypothetical protein [Shewanella sp. N2AIL]MCI2962145.1 hypothetical protein [Shewanella sp. N2AIL]